MTVRVVAVLALLAALLPSAPMARAAAGVRITSPTGRLVSSGPIRIVAQATPAPDGEVTTVRFFVNKREIGADSVGPVYAVEWIDDNPYEPVVIRVEASSGKGTVNSDEVTLPAMELTDETSVSSVLLDVAVLDEDGRYVPGLTREHFALREDGVVQAIELAEPSRVPTTVTLLVDTSQSMSSRFDFVRRATRRLASLLREQDMLAVVPFARELGPVTGPTRDPDALASAIDALRTRGGTAITDAVRDLADRLDRASGRQIVVLITDAYDEHSISAIAEAERALKDAGVTLYTVGIGGVAGVSFRGRDVLRDLALHTGGKAFFPARDAELPLVQEHIHDDVVNRYLITYTPANQRHDGSWRAITVQTGNPTHVLRTREGYLAPAPAPVRPIIEFTAMSTSSQPLLLSGADVEVREDGVVQSVTSFNEAVAPVSIILALDESGSMRKSEADVRSAALSFVDAVRDEDRIGVVTFSNTATLETDLTLSRAAPRMTIERYATAGGTALFDAVALSVERLATLAGRKAVVVLTDGRDENSAGTGAGSRHSLAELLDRLREVDAVVFAIGLGPTVDTQTLLRLADLSGGTAYFPQTASELPAQYARVLEDLRRQYTLSYASTNTNHDGRWRDVTLTAATPGIVLKSRGGYRAPAQ